MQLPAASGRGYHQVRRDMCANLALHWGITEIGMLRFIFTRLSRVIPIFIGITLLVFVLIRLIPGDPIETMAGERGIDPVRHEQLRKEYGFDQPVLVQYGYYLARLVRGDLGRSVVTHEPVISEFTTLFPATVELA